MRSQLRFAGKLAFLVIALLTAQCGGKTKSQQVQITVTPTNPIVFTNDFTYTDAGGNSVTVKGPQFNFTVQIENDSDTPMVVIGLHIDVTGSDANGNSTVVSTDYVPAQSNLTTTTFTCTYSDFGQFEAKGVTTGLGSSGSLQRTPDTGESSLCPKGALTFYAGGNPTPANTASIRYSVVVKPIGYFGTRGNQQDRFTGQGTFYTQ